MLSVFTIIVYFYLFFRYLYYIKNKITKYVASFLLFFSTQLFLISQLTQGVMVGEFSRPLLIIWLLSTFTFTFFALFSIIADLLSIITSFISKPFSKILIKQKTSLCLLIFSFAISALGMYNGMRIPNIKTEVVYVQNEKLNEPFKIVQLTDLHLSNLLDEKWIDEVVQKTNEQQPDLIVITGDLADGNASKHHETLKPLSKLKAKYGVYAVTGNHDYYSGYEEWMELYQKQNIHFLFNSSEDIGNIRLIGVPDIVAERFYLETPDMKKALKNVDNKKVNILLDHRPSSFRENSQRDLIDLQLSGHTHGGMLPILESIVAKFNNGFVAGRYENNGATLYLSNGTGIWNGFSLRLLHDSEITVILLMPK